MVLWSSCLATKVLIWSQEGRWCQWGWAMGLIGENQRVCCSILNWAHLTYTVHPELSFCQTGRDMVTEMTENKKGEAIAAIAPDHGRVLFACSYIAVYTR